MLTRIRHWTTVFSQSDGKPVADLTSYTIAALSKVEDWASDSDDFIRQQACIQMAFGSGVRVDPSGQSNVLDHTTHIFVSVGILHLEHQGKMLESEEVVPSSLRVVAATTGFQYLRAHRGDRRIKRIRIINTVKSIDVVLHNSIFNAVEPLLSLAPTSTYRQAKPSTTESENDKQNIVLMDNQIERAELQIIAAGLRLKSVLDRGSANLFYTEGRGLRTGQRSLTTCCATIASMETVLSVIRKRIHSASSMPTGVVATWQCKQFGGMANYTDMSDSSAPDNVKLLLSLRHFALDIQPQMKGLHDLINHIKEKDIP
jgi:hypothetical protein